MNIYMSGSMVHLGGDWTLGGITHLAIDSLIFALNRIELGKVRRILINCRDVISIDSSGQELLYVWMQCARLRGAEPELLNPPVTLQQAFQSIGLPSRHTNSNNRTSKKHWKRRSTHEYQRGQGNCQATSH